MAVLQRKHRMKRNSKFRSPFTNNNAIEVLQEKKRDNFAPAVARINTMKATLNTFYVELKPNKQNEKTLLLFSQGREKINPSLVAFGVNTSCE